MPRILPRLLEKIEKQAGQQKYFDFKLSNKGGLSLYKPVPPVPSFRPENHSRSILLTPLSPVTDAKEYARHKRMPPSLHKPGKPEANVLDPVRQMTKEEFGWWGNPYLRMISTPLRVCIVTQRYVPSDLLVRLVPMRPSTSRVSTGRKPSAKLVPDGLLHPKYSSRKVSGGSYVLCWRQAVARLERSPYKRISTELTIPSNIEKHVAHLLRVRVLQEFELIAERLEYAIKTRKGLKTSNVILRRLSREEWGSMKSTGSLPYRNALAVLIVPPVNKDVITKERPKSSMSPLPAEDEHIPTAPPPTSTLLDGTTDELYEYAPMDLPGRKIPLYNSVTAFPSRSQRMALYLLLMRILTAERFVKQFCHNKNRQRDNDQRKSKVATRSFFARMKKLRNEEIPLLLQ